MELLLLHFAADVMGSVCRMRPTSLTPDLSHSGGARACSEEPARTCWLSPLLGETVSGRLLLAFGHERLQEARHCCDFCDCGETLSTLVTSTVLSAQFCRAATTVPRALSPTPKPCLHCGEAPPTSSQASASCPCGPGTCDLTPGLARAGPAVPGSFLSVPRPQACSGGFSVQSSESWFSRWLPVKKRTEAYLPDDKNKSVSPARWAWGAGGSAAAGRPAVCMEHLSPRRTWADASRAQGLSLLTSCC